MTQLVKPLATDPNPPELDPGTHRMEGENSQLQAVQDLHGMSAPPPTSAHNIHE